MTTQKLFKRKMDPARSGCQTAVDNNACGGEGYPHRAVLEARVDAPPLNRLRLTVQQQHQPAGLRLRRRSRVIKRSRREALRPFKTPEEEKRLTSTGLEKATVTVSSSRLTRTQLIISSRSAGTDRQPSDKSTTTTRQVDGRTHPCRAASGSRTRRSGHSGR